MADEYRVKVTDEQVDDVLNQCIESESTGESKFPGMSFEQGVKYGIEWLIGNSTENPLED